MLYHAYEMTHAAISPMRAAARMGQEVIRNPFNLMSESYGSRAVSAAPMPRSSSRVGSTSRSAPTKSRTKS